MFQHLLVPLDGSRLAESVLPATCWLAEKFRAKITLLHILEEKAPATIHGEPHLNTLAEARAYLGQIAQRLEAADLKVDQHLHGVAEGNVARSILVHAEEMATDLILLCAHGSGGWRDRLIGPIAQQVLAGGTRPVFLTRPDKTGQPATFAPQQILVPLDGSPAHEPALPAARAIAVAGQATLHLITVVPTASTLSAERAAAGVLLPTTTHAILELAQRGATDYLQGWLRQLAGEQIKASAEVARGEIAPAILRAADRVKADLIVLGTHGRTAFDAFWSGSVTPKILSGAGSPVLLVRVTGEEAPR